MFRLSERINMVTGFQSSMLFDRQGDGRRKEEFELLQVSLGVTKFFASFAGFWYPAKKTFVFH